MPDTIKGAVGDNLRAARDWLPQPRALITKQDRCRAAVRFDDRSSGRAPDALRTLFERYEFRTGCASSTPPPPARPRHPSRTAAASIAPAMKPPDRGQLDAWIANWKPRGVCARHRNHQPQRDAAELVGISFATAHGEAAYLPLAHHYAGAPCAAGRTAVLAVEAAAENPEPRIIASSQITTAIFSPITASRSAASSTTRCCSPMCSKPTIARTRQSGNAPPRTGDAQLRRCHRQGASRIGFDRLRSSAPANTRRKTPTSRCGCAMHWHRRSPPSTSWLSCTGTSNCRWRRFCFAWNAPACCSTATCSRCRAASLAGRCWNWSSAPIRKPGSRSISARPSRSATSVYAEGPAGGQENPGGAPPPTRRPGAAGARPPHARAILRLPRLAR